MTSIARRFLKNLKGKNEPSYEKSFNAIREPKVDSWPHDNEGTERKIIDGLKAQGISVREYSIDVGKYRKYFEDAGYLQRYPKYYSDYICEKSLEHYLAATLIGLGPKDVYIDIASEGSPVPEIYERLYGCDTYRQDLSYKSGVNGKMIGGSAAEMPVPDGFATKMALHCSFEHFEGQIDIAFVREAGRVLRPGGLCCIVPLYMYETYAIQTDPLVAGDVKFEPDATVYASKNWGNRHGRLYDPANLRKRIIDNLGAMNYTLYKFVNTKEVDSKCYVRFALVLEKK